MRIFLTILTSILCSTLCYSQPGEHVIEPKSIDVVGEIKGDPRGNTGDRPLDGKDKDKRVPGKDFVSKQAQKDAKSIKAANSVNGKGTLVTATQRAEIIRQLEVERVRAAAENRRSDAKFFDRQKEKVKKIKLHIEGATIETEKKPVIIIKSPPTHQKDGPIR